MSVEQHKEIVRRAYEELWNGRRLEVADELVTDDFINHAAPPGTPPGRDALKQVVQMFDSAFPDYQWEVHDMIAEGDRVAVRDTFTGTHRGEFMGIKPTGKQVDMQAIHIYRLEDGKLAEHWVGRDDLGMLRQLGAIT